MLELKNIQKMYRIGATQLWALKGISLKIAKGEFIAFKGPSGSGKSTLLSLIGLLDTPTKGEYTINGLNVLCADSKKRSEYRAAYLGFIFQNFNLIPELNIYENVEIPLVIAGENAKARKEKVTKVVEAVGLTSHLQHKPGELSGGQMQRVAIARALVKNPPLVIADEPTANLDSKTGTEIIELMKRLNQELGITFLFATHDEKITEYMEKIYYLVDGEIVKVS
ncbi:MAG TPA: ABC transporter ATP-binding protein [Bacillota bacterium]